MNKRRFDGKLFKYGYTKIIKLVNLQLTITRHYIITIAPSARKFIWDEFERNALNNNN